MLFPEEDEIIFKKLKLRDYTIRSYINLGDFLYTCQRKKTNIEIGKTNVLSLRT